MEKIIPPDLKEVIDVDKALPKNLDAVIDVNKVVNYSQENNAIVHAPGIVSYQNVGDGPRYIRDVEELVSKKTLHWQPKDQKKIAEDYGRKAMDTMYIRNVRRHGNFDKVSPSLEVITHDRIFQRLERDFKSYIDRYTEEWHPTWSQKEDYEIMKYGEGNYFIDHVDDGLFYTRKISLVYYFNDDYDGGEIVFPKFGVTIKPKASQLLLFPSTYVYNHNVNAVTNGTRYSMVNWLK